jgi:O-antigen/teichoic acid export membrane protein
VLRKLGKSVLIYGLASSISKFIGIFLIPVFSRYYSPEQYGSIDLISTIISFIAILGMMQLESAISRFYFESDGLERKEYISTGFWTVIILSSVFLLLLIIVSDSISLALFNSTLYSGVLKLAACNIVLLNIFGYLTVVLRFSNKPLLYSGIVGIQFLITTAVSVILIVYYSYGVDAFFIGQAAGLAAGSTILIAYFRNSIVLVISVQILKQFFHYSLPQVPAVAGNWLNSYANRFIMIEYLTISDIGIYTVALKIASIFNLVDNAFRMAWEPFIWEKIKSPDHLELLRTMSLRITMIVFFIALTFILFSQELLIILSTADYIGGVPIAQMLFYAFAFPVLIHVFGIGTSISKKTIYNTLSFFIGTALNIGVLFILVPRIGLSGVPISLAVSNILIFSLMTYFSEKLYPIGFNFFKQIILTIIFSILAYALILYQPGFFEKLFLTSAFFAFAIYKWRYFYSLMSESLNKSPDIK